MPDLIRHPGKKEYWIPACAGMTEGVKGIIRLPHPDKSGFAMTKIYYETFRQVGIH